MRCYREQATAGPQWRCRRCDEEELAKTPKLTLAGWLLGLVSFGVSVVLVLLLLLMSKQWLPASVDRLLGKLGLAGELGVAFGALVFGAFGALLLKVGLPVWKEAPPEGPERECAGREAEEKEQRAQKTGADTQADPQSPTAVGSPSPSWQAWLIGGIILIAFLVLVGVGVALGRLLLGV
jgi:hypothetical protein